MAGSLSLVITLFIRVNVGAPWVKARPAKPAEFHPWNSHDGGKEQMLTSCPLPSVYML